MSLTVDELRSRVLTDMPNDTLQGIIAANARLLTAYVGPDSPTAVTERFLFVVPSEIVVVSNVVSGVVSLTDAQGSATVSSFDGRVIRADRTLLGDVVAVYSTPDDRWKETLIRLCEFDIENQRGVVERSDGEISVKYDSLKNKVRAIFALYPEARGFA